MVMKHTQHNRPMIVVVVVDDIAALLENVQPSEEEIQWRQRMVEFHKGNWRKLQEQLAVYSAGKKPLHLLNQVADEEAAIRRYGGTI